MSSVWIVRARTWVVGSHTRRARDQKAIKLLVGAMIMKGLEFFPLLCVRITWTPARNSKLLENSLSFDCRTAYTPGASIAKIFSPFLATPPEILDFAYFYPRIQLCSFPPVIRLRYP